jgi:hypothetical protein
LLKNKANSSSLHFHLPSLSFLLLTAPQQLTLGQKQKVNQKWVKKSAENGPKKLAKITRRSSQMSSSL